MGYLHTAKKKGKKEKNLNLKILNTKSPCLPDQRNCQYFCDAVLKYLAGGVVCLTKLLVGRH